MRMFSKIVLGIVLALGALFVLCLMLGGAFRRNERISEFFYSIAFGIRTILFLAMPVWLIAFIFGIGK